MFRPDHPLLSADADSRADSVRLVHLQALEPEPKATAEAHRAKTVSAALREAGWRFDLPTIVIRHRRVRGRGREAQERIRQVAIPRSKQAKARVRKGDVLVCVDLSALPAGSSSSSGSSSKSIMSLVATLALVVATTAIAGPIGAAIGVPAAIVSAALTIGGAYLISTYLNKSSTSSTTTKSLYDFSTTGNAASLFDPIPVLYGRMRTQPRYAAPAYEEYSGDDLYAYQLFCLGCGEYDIEEMQVSSTPFWKSADGLQSGFTDMQVQICNPGEQVTLFPWDVAVSGSVASINIATNAWEGPYVTNSVGTEAIDLAVDFQFPSGLGGTDSGGHDLTISVTVQAQAQQLDDSGNPVGSWFDIVNETFSGHGSSSTTAMRYTRKLLVPAGRYWVRFRRVTDSNNVSTVRDALTWVSLKAYLNGPQSFDDVTVIAIMAKATNSLRTASGQTISVIATRKLPIWNGTAWSAPTATRARAWAAADILRNSVYGAGLSDSEIALTTLSSLSGTWNGLNDHCDTIFDSATTVFEALQTVLNGGRAFPILAGGRIDFVRDEPTTLRRIFFTDDNIIRGSLSGEWTTDTEDTPDDVIVEYIDNRNWKASEVRCFISNTAGSKPTRITEKTITEHDLAKKFGLFRAADHRYRRRKYTFECEYEGKFLRRGTPCRLATDLLDYQFAAAGIVVAASGTTLTLSFDPPWSQVTGNAYVRLRNRRGEDYGPIKVTAGTGTRDIVLDAGDLSTVQTQTGQALADVLAEDGQEETRAAFLFGGSGVTRECKVYSVSPQGPNRISVTLVEDDPRVYQAVGEGGSAGLPDAPPSSGQDTTIPIVTGFSAYRRQEGLAFQLYGSWSAAPGATSYEAQISYDGANWSSIWTSDSGSATKFAVQMGSGAAAYVRIRGKGTLEGPWATQDLPEKILTGIEPSLQRIIDDFTDSVHRKVDQLFSDQTAFFDQYNHWGVIQLEEMAWHAGAFENFKDFTATDWKVQQSTNTAVTASLGANAAAITTEQTARASADQAMATNITNVTAQVNTNTAAISTEQTARASADQAMASNITTITAQVNTNTAAISTEQTTRANADQAMATSITNLTATVNTNTASISTEQTTRANAVQSLADSITTLNTNVFNTTSNLTQEQIVRSNADQALSSEITTLSGKVDNTSASLSSEITARANGDSALSGSLTTLQTTVNGQAATLQTYGTSINGLQVQYGVVGTISNVSGGFIFTGVKQNNGSVTYGVEFGVDYFLISSPYYSGVAKQIFAVGYNNGSPTIGIRADCFIDGTITAKALVVGTITGTYISTNTLVADHIVSNEITDIVAATGQTVAFNNVCWTAYVVCKYGRVYFNIPLSFTIPAGNTQTVYTNSFITAIVYRDGAEVKRKTRQITPNSYIASANTINYDYRTVQDMDVTGIDFPGTGYHVYQVIMYSTDSTGAVANWALNATVTGGTGLLMENIR